MRRGTPWLLWLALVLLVLLTGLAILQYRWLDEVSAAGRERMQAALRARAEQFTEEFDRDLARAYFWLQVEPDAVEGGARPGYASRYDRWLASASHPRLVKEVWLFLPDALPRRYDPRARDFGPAPLPENLRPVADAFQETSGSSPGGAAPRFHAIREEIPVIIAPVPQLLAFTGQRNIRIEQLDPSVNRGFTAIVLDADYMRGELLPQLANRAFGSAGSSEYHLAIRSRSDRREVFSYGPSLPHAEGPADVTLALFDIRIETIADLRSADRAGMQEQVLKSSKSAAADRPEGPASLPPIQDRVAVKVVQREAHAAIASRLALPGPRWELLVRHRAGSLEKAVAAGRRRNLVLSGGILALLAASVILLVVSAQRASRLAGQQMEFVAAVSHELRTPLAVIRSAADNLAEGVIATPDHVRRYGELVRSEGLRLSTMVEQILAFSGMRGSTGPRTAPVHVRDLVDQAIERARPELQAAQLDPRVDVPADLPVAMLDPEAVGRALSNLLSNAAKYAREGGVVEVAARSGTGRSGRELVIAVRDHGPGIAPEDLPHVFEPFYRSPSVIASRVHGTGLGLSLVAAIARSHGGHVSVRTPEGGGSVFTLHLPHLAPPDPAHAGQPLPASRP